MKILLINPAHSRLRGSGQSPFFPLGLGYLAAVLAENDFDPLIYNAELCRPREPMPEHDMRRVFEKRSEGHQKYLSALGDNNHIIWQELREVLEQVKPDLVGITALSVQYGAVAKTARLVKQWQRQCPVVFGGHHATYLPEDALQSCHDIDVVVLGEGEVTFLALCRAYREEQTPDFSKIPGLAYRDSTGIALSPPRELIKDLDTIPFPRKDLVVFPERYATMHFSSLILGRGCPWRCKFCSSKKFWNRQTRMRSPQNCLDEIKMLMGRYNLNDFMFWDDAFTVNRKIILEFCRLVLAERVNFSFRTATRADLVDDELIDFLKQAGCIKLTIGVETGSPRIAQMIRKDIDFDVLRHAIKIIRKHKIAIGTFFMAGFPDETVNDMRMTFDLIKEINVDEVAFNIFDPMPGSELYDMCIDLGMVSPNADWTDFPLWPDAYYCNKMTPAEFDALAWEIAKYTFKKQDGLISRFKRNIPLLVKNPKAFGEKVVQKLAGQR
jgi:radical SAM superfamily enzyme YgiQ (UPF0313 family)